jgi:hypothetical protein
MTGDDRAVEIAEPHGRGAAHGTVVLEVAAAHAGRLDFDDHLARPRRGVGEIHDFQLSVAVKHNRFHRSPPLVDCSEIHDSGGSPLGERDFARARKTTNRC